MRWVHGEFRRRGAAVEALEGRRLMSAAALPPGSAGPDLAVSSFSVAGLSPTAYAGQRGTATLRVANLGNTIALGSVPVTLLAVSPEAAADLSSATAVASFTRRLRVRPGAVVTLRARFTISAEPTAGSYVLVAQINNPATIAETNFANNAATGPAVTFAHPAGNLAVAFARPAPLVMQDGKPQRVVLTLTNFSAVRAVGSADVKLFASTDTTLDMTDPRLTEDPAVPVRLPPGGAKDVRLRFTVPADLAGGDYFLIAQLQPSVLPPDTSGAHHVAVSPTGTAVLGPGAVTPPPATAGQNLLSNGDFSAGNSGFTSGYRFSTDLITEGDYYVGADPQTYNFAGQSFGDHTTGSGLMLIANGSPTANATVWQETVGVQPQTTYSFAAWFRSWGLTNGMDPSPAMMRVTINGRAIAPTFTLPAESVWAKLMATWSSGSFTTATITITDLNTTLGGNDFALDDLSFAAGAPTSASSPPGLLFADSFNVSASGAVMVNDDLNERQTGALAPLSYTIAQPYPLVNDPLAPGALVLTGISGGPGNGASPDENFDQAPGRGKATVIELDVNPVVGSDPSQAFTDTSWVCIDLGSTAAGRNQYPQFTDGVGILFRGDGRTQAFDNHQNLGESRFAPAADDRYHHVRIEIADAADGNPFDGDGSPVTIRAFADGAETPFFTHTVVGGFLADFLSFVGEGEGGPGGAIVHHAIDNVTVSIGTPIA